MSYEINEENLKLKFDEENPLLPNWEVYEQISGLPFDEIPTKGKWACLSAHIFERLKSFLMKMKLKVINLRLSKFPKCRNQNTKNL